MHSCLRCATLLDARFAATPTDFPTCQPNQSFCQGTIPGQFICCDSGWVCAQSCDGDSGQCEPYCEPQLCFPGEATVREETGTTKLMKDVRIGDRLQVVMPDGSLRYEDVYLLTHNDPNVAGSFVELDLASGQSLTLSPRHFIPIALVAGAAWESRVLNGANEVKVGDVVWHQGSDGAMLATTVTAVTEEIVGNGCIQPAHPLRHDRGGRRRCLRAQRLVPGWRRLRRPPGADLPGDVRARAWDLSPDRSGVDGNHRRGLGVVDFARERTSPQPSGSRVPGHWSGRCCWRASASSWFGGRGAPSCASFRRRCRLRAQRWSEQAPGARHHQRRIERHRPGVGVADLAAAGWDLTVLARDPGSAGGGGGNPWPQRAAPRSMVK